MQYDNIFHLVSEVLRQSGVQAVLIGGFAVNFYRFSRATGDIDFLMTEEDYKKACPFFEKAGCQQVFQSTLYVSLKSEFFPLMPIDVGFVDRKTLEGMIREGTQAEIMGCKFTVPSLNHLIALKLHAVKNNPENRERWDIRDIMELIKINKVNVDDESFRDLCMRYGGEDSYKKIKELASKWKT